MSAMIIKLNTLNAFSRVLTGRFKLRFKLPPNRVFYESK